MRRINEKGKVSFEEAFHDYCRGILSYGGRSTRSGYWWGQVVCLIFALALYTIFYGSLESSMASGHQSIIAVGSLVVSVGGLLLYIAEYAILARRLRDIGFQTFPVVVWIILRWMAALMVKLFGMPFGIILLAVLAIQLVLCCLPTDYFARQKASWITRAKENEDLQGSDKMTKTAAVMIAPGCEEIEALTPVDALRRLGVKVDMVGLESIDVMGAHGIKLTCDKVMDESLLDYDIVIFPGGSKGADNLRGSDQLMDLIQQRHAAGKWNAAMCSGPVAFARYGLLDNCTYTCFPGVEKQFENDIKNATHSDEIVVVDEAGKIITSRGPATAMAYAFKIAEILGVDPAPQEEAMLYNYLRDEMRK